MIKYERPNEWIKYNPVAIVDHLTRAKAAVLSLQTVPYQKRWVEALQTMELKREVAGTSRIEGAEFTDGELKKVMKKETDDELFTRSQKQARAALSAYEWIAATPDDYPVNRDTILLLHRLIVTGADDDHCPPGELRRIDNNVSFGTPPHRGCDGGAECVAAFDGLNYALRTKFLRHDPLVQAIAAHYHIAAMHPFHDGNGRTARALEAFMLKKAGLRDTSFIAMSNYYYEEKPIYLATLAQVRADQYDLTAFLRFALTGIEKQAMRLLREIQREIKQELLLNLAHDLFNRLESPRKKVIGKRQLSILRFLLREGPTPIIRLMRTLEPAYKQKFKSPNKAMIRDINGLLNLGVVRVTSRMRANVSEVFFEVDLDWPQQITESEFFTKANAMPKASKDWLEEATAGK